MFVDRPFGSLSSFPANAWVMAFPDTPGGDSYESTFDAVMVENPYGGMANGSIPITQDEMPMYADDGNIFSMERNSALEGYLTHVPSKGFSRHAGSVYDPLACHPSQCLTLNTNLDMLQADSNLVSSQEDFVIPSQTTFLNTCDLNSTVRAPGYDTSPISECPTDYSFESPEDESRYLSSVGSISSCGSVKSEGVTPTRNLFDLKGLGQALETSAALHRVQFDNRESRSRQKKPAKREPSMIPNFSLKVQRQAKKTCSFAGCHKKFQRQEHLKRHERTHTNNEWHPCPFCKKTRPFSRADNFKSHIKLHCAYKKSSRTDFHPGAQDYYDELCRKSTRKSTVSRK